MRNSAPFRRRRLGLTPLIDVIFLLLLFFMLTSTFSTFGEIELSQATGGTGTSDTPGERVFLQVGPDRLALNGKPTVLEELSDQIEEGQVLISMDDETSAQSLVDVLVTLRGRDDLTVTVLE
ncbi:MAG: ExbD/TolR family protein [Paracoccaceae bacterium]